MADYEKTYSVSIPIGATPYEDAKILARVLTAGAWQREGAIWFGDMPANQAAEDELRAEIAAHAAAGREAEREAAADRLAAAIMVRTLPRRDDR